MNGVINIYKNTGMTSFDVVAMVRRVAKMKGQLKVNREKIRMAEVEEARELLRTNQKLNDKIKDDTKIINDQLRRYEERLEAEEAKKKASGRAAYFDEVRAEKERQKRKE